MKKIFALLTVFLAISGCDGSLTSNESELDQYVLDASIWTVQLGTGTTDSAQAVSIDNDGNLFLAGYTSGDLEGNGNAGGHDLFLVKYNSSGDRQWSRQLGTSDNDSAFATATDSSGNVFAAGYTGGGLDGQTHIGSFDIFLVKYDTNGNRLWSVLHGSDNVTAKDVIFGMETDTEGNAYLAGYTDAYLDNNTSAGGDDLILIKYNSSGTRQWTVQSGTSAADYARGVSLDSSGNIYLAGYTSGGLGSNSNSGSEDLFLIKYNSSGSRQWTQQLGSYSNDVAFDVATDSSGNTYITGYTGGPLDGNTNAGELDLILVKYDSSGNKSWTKQLGTSTSDYARGVSVDADGNVCVSGYTTAALDGQTHYGSDDLFLVKYDSSGNKSWTRQLGTSTLDRAVDVIHDTSGNAYVAGSTLGDLDYQRSQGGDDLFLVKFSSDGVKQ